MRLRGSGTGRRPRGDPHAGNIAYIFEDTRPRIILYDWAMTGRLKRLERFGLLLLGAGLLTRNRTISMLAVDFLSSGQGTTDVADASTTWWIKPSAAKGCPSPVS
ncbi:MAG: hypothetical protein U5J82_00415 [Desulfobacterales bacterium]|nr:hypothetical protein [Desulfobacterales bacterium]